MYEVLGAFAHHGFDTLLGNGGQGQIRQHQVQRHGEVTHGVYHGAVEVDDGGVKMPWIEVNRFHNKPIEFEYLRMERRGPLQ